MDETHYRVGEGVFIEGVNRNERECYVIEPLDFLNSLDSGYMIINNIVDEYMNLLVYSDKYVLKVVTTSFGKYLYTYD